MRVGDLYIHIKDKREAKVVGFNDSVVEYQFTSLMAPKGTGALPRKLNVMTVDLAYFEKMFKASK